MEGLGNEGPPKSRWGDDEAGDERELLVSFSLLIRFLSNSHGVGLSPHHSDGRTPYHIPPQSPRQKESHLGSRVAKRAFFSFSLSFF